MPELEIVKYPNPILSQKAEPVKDVHETSIQKLLIDMLETMEKNNGVGLAAPQIGKSIRLCVVRVDNITYKLINPRITYRSWKTETCEEGCLSFPTKFIPVKRHWKVRVKALNELGLEINIKAEGLLSRALQHEIDHLDGNLFITKEVKLKKTKNKC